MFAKLARFHGIGRRHAMLPQATHCNDNHPIRRLAAVSRRAPRRGLVCGWRPAPATRRLECFWQVVPADAAAAEDPGISRMIGCQPRRRDPQNWLAAVAVAGKFVTVEHIANCSLGYRL
jgi:hypothetical protein